MNTSAGEGCIVCHPPALKALIDAEPELKALWPTLPRRQWASDTTILRAGQPCDRSWLVERGLLRVYHLTAHGVERNSSFHAEGSWIGGISLTQAVASPWHVETLEPSQAVELDNATLREYGARFPSLQPALSDAMSHLLLRHARREADLLSLSRTAHYQSFLLEAGELAERVPLHHIASYLGISPVSLSRIRARLGMVPSALSADPARHGANAPTRASPPGARCGDPSPRPRSPGH